ncbi:hypothetical protein B0T25DRAFT_565304 [Lasiosphaeria hispida]|uniref:Arca-like protein n=1 Tax=Lasiosphaeria hispida TaxID=260671 RepID=A0AAJ0HSI9_9PEZI|nr:hypothetical protein B0T25DRAFT_565304 [Lasiosphaeria hispida]
MSAGCPQDPLVFIDETRTVVSDAASQDSGADDADVDFGSPCISEDSYPPDALLSAGVVSVSTPSVGHGGSPTDRFIQREMMTPRNDESPVSPTEIGPHARVRAIPDPKLRFLMEQVYVNNPMWPLSDPTEAVLFRHFVQKLAIWLDLCDPEQNFQTKIPKQAGTCTVLMNAIFALASRHMSHVSNHDPLASNRYIGECLKHLKPILHYPDTMRDENLFAATIIQRVWEEMEVVIMGQDHQGYMLSIHRFVENGRLTPGSLSAAAFWIGLRQEIYIAVMSCEKVRVRLVPSLIDQSFSDASDYMWANRAVVHCAEVLNFCFGDEYRSATRPARWSELDAWNKQWSSNLPPYCAPIFNDKDSDSRFPEIWYHKSCHAIGAQHHILAALFLARYDPNMGAYTDMKERIQSLVRRICGIGLGNQWTPPSMFTACMAIAAFAGECFCDRRDQEAILGILRKTEKDHARPTKAVQEEMMRKWNWVPEDAGMPMALDEQSG